MWTRDDDVRMCEQSNAQRHIRRVFSFNLSVTLLHLRKCIFRCRKKKKSCLCRWAVIGDYSSLLCQIYRAREHSLDWICGRCLCRMSLSGTFVFMQVPGWSLNQISLTCSQDACRLRRDGSLFCARIDRLPAKRLCFGISWGRKCFLPFLFSGDIVVLQHSPPLS